MKSNEEFKQSNYSYVLFRHLYWLRAIEELTERSAKRVTHTYIRKTNRLFVSISGFFLSFVYFTSCKRFYKAS